jgi:membrane protease YdiL (CAAX protease family)
VHGAGPHGYDLTSEVEVGITGVWYRLVFELSGSLLPGIVAHATWNAIALWQELAGGGADLPCC